MPSKKATPKKTGFLYNIKERQEMGGLNDDDLLKSRIMYLDVLFKRKDIKARERFILEVLASLEYSGMDYQKFLETTVKKEKLIDQYVVRG